jgi:CRISPR system Cascade subunit CasE
MFLSRLQHHPRSRQALRDLADPYQMHRTLLRAFPDDLDGGAGRVLYRVEVQGEVGLPVVLVQSDKRPDWSCLPTGHLVEPAEWKPYDPAFIAGQHLRFRLRANPTIKTGTSSRGDRLAHKPKCNGRRVGLIREEDQVAWLSAKGSRGGFRIAGAGSGPPRLLVTKEGYLEGRKQTERGRQNLTHLAVRFDGTLEVADPVQFLDTVRVGIGPAKGFGFGLLSLAREGGA